MRKAEKYFKPKPEQSEKQGWLGVPLLRKWNPDQRQEEQEEYQYGGQTEERGHRVY